jgi:hypothetical protein
MDKLKIISNILPFNIIFLNYLRLMNYDDIREFMLKSHDYSMYPGFISKILNYHKLSILHLFRFNNEYYINNNYYNYHVKNNEIVPVIEDEFENSTIDYIQLTNETLINSNPEILIIQEDNDTKETEIMKSIINNPKYPKEIFNIKTYLKNKKFNIFKYKIQAISLEDAIAFVDNDEKYIYKNNKIVKSEWKLNSKILLSIYRLL